MSFAPSLRFSLFVVLITAFLAFDASAFAQSARQGAFQGASGHRTSGTASVEQTSQGYVLTLGRDFRFDGAPDPKLAFGRNGYTRGTIFARLNSNSGLQRYRIPANLDVSQFTEVWLWCERFNVPLGVARIQ